MSQCSLPDHAGFRHTKYLIRTLDFSRQNFLLIRGIWWMVSCTALPTLTKVGLRWRQLFCPLPLLWFDYGSETRKIHFFPSAEKGERYNSSYVLYFTKVYTNKYFGTFSTLCSVINLIVQLWWKWTYILKTYYSPGEGYTVFLPSHTHVIGYSRLGGRLGQCCVEMADGTVSEDAISSFIGYYKVARENGSESVPCNSPTMQKFRPPPPPPQIKDGKMARFVHRAALHMLFCWVTYKKPSMMRVSRDCYIMDTKCFIEKFTMPH